MPSTAVCSLTSDRDTGTNSCVVKQAVEYILAQPDGKTCSNTMTMNAKANAVSSALSAYIKGQRDMKDNGCGIG
jgi:hypothetical protein